MNKKLPKDKMKRVQLEPWSSLERHCLTAAVVKVGDQNWTAVSRATSKLYEDIIKWRPDGDRHPPEWFSIKQCAAQYEHMLKTLSSRRKKRSERGGDQPFTSDSPVDVLYQICYQEHMEDAKKKVAEQQLEIERLTKKVLDIMNGDYDDRLEEMLTEIEAKEREKDIKQKLKSKLGERCFAESSATITDPADHLPPTAAQPDLLTTPTKATGKEVGTEPPKTSVTTSPLLTSLLQSPSPLTRPSSATPTISLLLNSSPPVPSSESPTLSKLLESSCPAGTPPNSTTSSSQLHHHLQTNTSATRLQSPPSRQSHHRTSGMALSTALADHCLVAPGIHHTVGVAPTVTSAPSVKDEFKSMIIDEIKIAADLVTNDASQKVPAKGNDGAKQEAEKHGPEKKGVPNTSLSLNQMPHLYVDADMPIASVELPPKEAGAPEITQRLDQLIDQVPDAIPETAVDENSAKDVLAADASKVALSRTEADIITTASEEPMGETLDLTSDAVDLIVMGSGQLECVDSNRNMDSIQDDVSKGEEVPDIDEIQPSISVPDISSYGPNVEAALKVEQANDGSLLKSSSAPSDHIDHTQLLDEHPIEENILAASHKKSMSMQNEIEVSRTEHTRPGRTPVVTNDSTTVSQSEDVGESSTNAVSLDLVPVEQSSIDCDMSSPKAEKGPNLTAPAGESSELIEKQIEGATSETQNVDQSSSGTLESSIGQNDLGSGLETPLLEENQTDTPEDNSPEKPKQVGNENLVLDGATEAKAPLNTNTSAETGKLEGVTVTGPSAGQGKGDYTSLKLEPSSELKCDASPEKLNDLKKQPIAKLQRVLGVATQPTDPKQNDGSVTVVDNAAASSKRSDDPRSSPVESLGAKGSEDSDSTSSSLDKSFILQNQPMVIVERTPVSDGTSSPSVPSKSSSSIGSPPQLPLDESAHILTKDSSDEQIPGDRTLSEEEAFFRSEKNSGPTTGLGLPCEEIEKKIRQVESDKDESTQGTKDETDDVNSVPESHFDDEEDTQDHDYIPPRLPAIEPDEVTVSTENTSDSTDKLSLAEESEFSGEEKIDESDSFPKMKRRKLSVDRKQRSVATEKSLLKTLQVEKMAAAIDDSKPISGTKMLRRGRATPPTILSEKPLKEKRPVTPSSSSDSKEEASSRVGRKKRSTNISESSIPCSPSPSNVSNEDDKEYRAWKKSILLVYDRIAAHKYASVFMRPISEDDAPGYFKVILKPTDLTTIKKQIESGVIRTTVEFQRELMLMLSNALVYNKSDSLVFKMAFEMLQDVKEAMATMVQALGSGVPLDQLESSPATTARVSRASTSCKVGPSDATVLPPVKRKRPTTSDSSSRLKRKRSDAS